MQYPEEPKAKLYGFDIPIQCLTMRVGKSDVFTGIHYHDYVELLYGIDCDIKVWSNGRALRLKSGDLAVIHSKKPHAVLSCQDTSTYIVIKFMPQILYAAEQSMLEFKYIVPFIAENEIYTNMFKREELENSPVADMIENIRAEWEAKEYGFEIALRAYTMKIALWLIRYWKKEISGNQYGLTDETTDAMRSMQKSIEFARGNYSTATANDAAGLCNLSYCYFSRLFKRVMNKSFTQYVNYIRITEAERLLACTNMSITAIAFEVGFSTTSYFIEKFKNEVGMTPKQFRSSFKKI